MSPRTSRPMLPKEYRASDLRSELGISSVPNDERSLHTLFAILINDVDRRADVHQSIKPEILEGLAQTWLYFLENESGVDVEVSSHRHGIDTSIDDPEDYRPASSIGRNGIGESIFDERLREQHDSDVSLAQFERDMRRLDDLRRQSAHPGLNTAESNELHGLLEEYGLEHRDWWQRRYLRESGETTDSTTVSNA